MDLFEHAEREALAGMERALGHAERVEPDWGDIAYRFLVRFAGRHDSFISEDVSDATKLDATFPQPPTDRAWGAVYRRAIKDGVIARASTVGRSRRRHGSVCPMWRSQINQRTAA